MGFGVFTDSNGEMVLYAEQRWAEYSANPSAYQYLIPDLTPNDGTRNNLHIIDMIVGPSDDDTADFYVDGVAVPTMQNLMMLGSTFSNGAVQFGDCCGNVNDAEWAIEWLKVEEGITVPHAAPEVRHWHDRRLQRQRRCGRSRLHRVAKRWPVAE